MRYVSQSAFGGRPVAARAFYGLRGLGFEPVTTTMAIKAGVTLVAGAIAGWIRSARIRGVQKENATMLANEAERHLQDNLNAYMSGPRTVSDQRAALESFDRIWAWLTSPEGCGNYQLGDAGRRCISERAAGGTVPGAGGNWFVWYRDPIANDPEVQPDPAPATAGTGGGSGAGGNAAVGGGDLLSGQIAGIPASLLLAGTAILLALSMGRSN